jgi:hypothetical protein
MVFSTPVIQNVLGSSYAIPPPKEHQSHVNPFPSSPARSSSLSSYSPGESSNASNQEDKKKKKMKIKKKKNKKGANLPTTTVHVGGNQPITLNQDESVDDIDKPTQSSCKPKLPWRLCKGDHLLKYLPGLSKILEVWSTSSQQPVSPTSSSHVGDNPSTSDSKVGSKKGGVKFTCRLCEGSHQNYLCLRMDEASRFLEDIVVS